MILSIQTCDTHPAVTAMETRRTEFLVYTATINDTDATDGLTLTNFTVSLTAGITEESDLADITQITGTDTWHVACYLNVNAATAVVGVHAVAYNLNVVLN